MNCSVNQVICRSIGILFIGCFLMHHVLEAQTIAPAGTTKADIYKRDIQNRTAFLSNYSKGARNVSAAAQTVMNTDLKNAASRTMDDKSYNDLLTKCRLAYVDLLKKKINATTKSLYAEVSNPWQDISSDMFDPAQVGTGPKNIQTRNFINAGQYIAFWVCNMDDAPQSVNITLNNNTALSTTNLYEAKYVLSRTYKYCPDALVPVTAAVNFQPGEVKFFMMSQVAKKAGTDKFNILIKGNAGSRSIPVSIINDDVVLDPNRIGLNTVNWAYYFYPMLQGKETQATSNLVDHHINSLIVTKEYLPAMENLTASPQFLKYIPYCKPYKNIMLGLDIRRQHNKPDYLSDKWKATFIQWYNLVLSEFKKQSVDPAQKNIYLYLVDEATPAEVSYLTDFITWIRKARPDIKLYATIFKQPAVDALVPLLDVSQLLSTSLMSVNVKNKDMSKIWLYDTQRRWNAPYTSYRLVAWEAFYKGYGGIGFWNYADLSKTADNKTSSWDDFDGKYADFSAIYDANSKILNSRRWEAFKVGLEDYYVLQLFAKKYGNDQAKAYCNKVLSSVKNTAAADVARNEMLSKL